MADIKISQMTAGTPDENTLFEGALDGGGGVYSTRSVSASALATLLNTTIQYGGLTTSDDTIVGAINELAQGGGGASVIQLTMSQYTALPSADKNNGSIYKITDKALIYCLDEEYHAMLEITSADYAQLTSDEQNNGTLYVITDEETTADDIPYSAGVSVADKLAEVSVSYDLTEKVVGVWQDGKPLYEKTINWNGTISTGTQDINTNITNPKFVFFDTVILNDNSLNTLCFPYISTNANVNGYITADGTKVHIDVGTYWNTHKLYFAFKLRYTKTTD